MTCFFSHVLVTCEPVSQVTWCPQVLGHCYCCIAFALRRQDVPGSGVDTARHSNKIKVQIGCLLCL